MPIQIDRQGYQNLSKLEFLARQVVEGFITGMHKSPFHGFSVEFAEHRQYNTGESTRHIDWKHYARTEKLFVKRYEEETNLRCRIVLDISSSMNYPEITGSDQTNKLNFSIHCAAAIMEIMRRQRDAVGLTCFSNKIDYHSQVRSAQSHHKVLFNHMEEILNTEAPNQKTGAASALSEIAERIHKRSLVIVFSDMFDTENGNDELFSSLQRLKFNKHEVILFHVTDKKTEIDFDFKNRPYTFVDTETGEEVKLNPGEIKSQYLDSIKTYTHDLTLKCGQYGIEFISVDIADGYNPVLLKYLVKRKKLF
jgi:uncharacterized protein (DUF58 family)